MGSARDPQFALLALRAFLGALLLLGTCAEPGEDQFRVVHHHTVVRADGGLSGHVEQVSEVEPEVAQPETSDPDSVRPDVAEPDTLVVLDGSLPTDSAADSVGGEDVAGELVDSDVGVAPCPADMVELGRTCIDRWEAPNVAGLLPLVMYTFSESEAWCGARAKRLCFDDEWLGACAGPAGWRYPYGDVREPGRCNDDKTWRLYTQALLNGWPAVASAPSIGSLDALLQAARARGGNAVAAADHVMSLYQGTAAGERASCVGEAGVEDLVGNVEEWVRRRDGGDGAQFSGALVGRYWAESRTCQSRVTAHGNAFRFYEIGFRCCRDSERR